MLSLQTYNNVKPQTVMHTKSDNVLVTKVLKTLKNTKLIFL